MSYRSSLSAFVFIVAAMSASPPASGQVATTWTAGGLFEAFVGASEPGHGALYLQTRFAGERGTTGSITLNTETLESEVRLPLASRLALRASAKGEVLAANVLPDSYERLRDAPGRGFSASYVQLATGLDMHVHRRHTVRANAHATRWFLANIGSTSEAFVLPPDPWTARLSASWTYWAIQPDIGFGALHRRRERIRGVGVGVELGADLRTPSTAWGAPEALRANDPDAAAFVGAQWLRLGTDLSDRLRVQLVQRAHFSTSADDLTRERIGGQAQPFVTPLAGLPWAIVRSGRFVSAQPALAVRVANRHEVGALLDVVGTGLDGEDAFVGLWGAALFADLRWEHWQVDASIGASPARARAETPFVGLLFGFGWSG